MQIMVKTFYYAVSRGRQIGIFDDWNSCKRQVDGFQGARFKKFSTQAECHIFINANSGTRGL